MNAPDHREPLCGEASPGATPGDGLDAAMGKTHNDLAHRPGDMAGEETNGGCTGSGAADC